MRTKREERILRNAQRRSKRYDFEKTILQTEHRREFFKYHQGTLIEYDLTVFNGQPVEWQSEEREVIQEMFGGYYGYKKQSRK